MCQLAIGNQKSANTYFDTCLFLSIAAIELLTLAIVPRLCLGCYSGPRSAGTAALDTAGFLSRESGVALHEQERSSGGQGRSV